MLTIPYETVLASVVASGMLGATIATWVLRTVVDENRALASRIQQWESRVGHNLGLNQSTQDMLAITARPRLAVTERASHIADRLLGLSRRKYEGSHKLNPAAQSVRRWHAGNPAGWLPAGLTVQRLAIEAGPAALALARWEEETSGQHDRPR